MSLNNKSKIFPPFIRVKSKKDDGDCFRRTSVHFDDSTATYHIDAGAYNIIVKKAGMVSPGDLIIKGSGNTKFLDGKVVEKISYLAYKERSGGYATEDIETLEELGVYEQECQVCGSNFLDEEPARCCDGRECGCYGQPIEPCVCSSECFDELIGAPVVGKRVSKRKPAPVGTVRGVANIICVDDIDDEDEIDEYGDFIDKNLTKYNKLQNIFTTKIKNAKGEYVSSPIAIDNDNITIKAGNHYGSK